MFKHIKAIKNKERMRECQRLRRVGEMTDALWYLGFDPGIEKLVKSKSVYN